jgi:hypothetical protein
MTFRSLARLRSWVKRRRWLASTYVQSRPLRDLALISSADQSLESLQTSSRRPIVNAAAMMAGVRKAALWTSLHQEECRSLDSNARPPSSLAFAQSRAEGEVNCLAPASDLTDWHEKADCWRLWSGNQFWSLAHDISARTLLSWKTRRDARFVVLRPIDEDRDYAADCEALVRELGIG